MKMLSNHFWIAMGFEANSETCKILFWNLPKIFENSKKIILSIVGWIELDKVILWIGL